MRCQLTIPYEKILYLERTGNEMKIVFDGNVIINNKFPSSEVAESTYNKITKSMTDYNIKTHEMGWDQ